MLASFLSDPLIKYDLVVLQHRGRRDHGAGQSGSDDANQKVLEQHGRLPDRLRTRRIRQTG